VAVEVSVCAPAGIATVNASTATSNDGIAAARTRGCA
jgi:hypothetical protein